MLEPLGVSLVMSTHLVLNGDVLPHDEGNLRITQTLDNRLQEKDVYDILYR